MLDSKLSQPVVGGHVLLVTVFYCGRMHLECEKVFLILSLVKLR